MPSKTYEAIIGVVDRYSAPILAVEEKLRHMGEVADAANKKMTPHQKLFSNVMADLGGLGDRFNEVGKSANEFGARIADVLGPLSAIGAAGSIAGLVEMTHNFAEATEQLSIGAKIAGTSVQTMQALNYAAKMTGVSTDGLQRSLGMMNKNLGAAAVGKNKDVVSLMQHFGISMFGANHQLLSSAQLLPKIAEQFAKLKNPALEAFDAQILFGRSGRDLLPLLDQGAAGLAAYEAQFRKLGYTLTNQDVDAGDKFNEAWKNMQTAVGGLSDDIGAKLAPVLTPLINMMTDLLVKNRDWIALHMQEAVKGMSDELTSIDWSKVQSALDKFGSKTMDVIGDVGGFKTILIVTGAAMTASFLAPLASMTKQLAVLGWTMGGPVLKSMLAFTVEFVGMLDVMSAGPDVMAALNLAFASNPLGAIALGAVAVGVAVYQMYEHWGWISKKLQEVWKWLEREFHMVFHGTILGGIGAVNAAAQMMEGVWGGLSKGLDGIWKTIDGDFHEVFDGIVETIDKVSKAIQEVEGGGPGAPAKPGGGHAGERYVPHGRFGGAWVPDAVPLDGPGGAGGGKVEHVVTINGLPPGATVRTRITGRVPEPPKLKLGYSGMIPGPV